MAAPVSSTVCSLCGQTLEREGNCLACLLRGGLDESEEEPLPSNSLVFGDFEIELRDDGSLWELGRGAMGVTYRARDKMLHRDVALKVIEVPTKTEGAHATRERFLREARAAAAFRHTNVASVFQIGAPTDTGRCYYAMELVEGETLATLVRCDGPLPVAAALDIATQVARALVAAAAHGLIHRDLKPANIMLTPNEAQPAALEAKVIDFGLAKATAEAVDEMDLTHGEFVGTPTFASPEQFGGKAADARSDIYSLGVTLWYALTGEVPYEGKTIEEIRHCQSDLPLPVEKLVARKIPTPVVHLLRRILAVDPTQRPASARELMEALETCRSRLGLIPAHGLRARQTGRKLAALVVVAAIVAAVFIAFWLRGHKAAAPAPALAKSIAVLPFENRSEDKANAYFADGIQDEILTRLSKIGDLKVISRTSTEKYRSRPIDLKTLAEELSVSAVLEGSVQKAGGKVRVAVHLIEAQSDHPLWAESYDRSLEDVFAVQSEIAGAVANALHATLTPEESVALQNVPTRNQKAYDLFLRAEYFLRIGQGNMSMAKITEAIALYRQALAEDPDFALAYAGLSNAESYVRFIGADPANEPPDQAKIHAEKAAALQPDLVQAHLALAHCESAGRLDYSGALKHLTRAQALAPRSVEVLMSLAGVYRRLLRFNDAIAVLERATQYDPGNPILFADLGTTYTWARRYDRIQPVLEHALALNPADDGATLQLAHFLIEQRGDMEGARKLLHGRGQFLQVVLADTYRLTREYEKAISLIEELPADCDAFASSEKSKDQLLGEHMHSAGQDEVARPLLERAREHRITLLADKTLSPRRVSFNSIRLAEIELALGNGQAAVQIAERDAQSDWVTHDPTFLQWYRGFLAKIYADVGRKDEAIALISGLLKSEFYFTDITPMTLRLDPDWDPLRNDPRFQALLKEYPTDGGENVGKQ